MNPTKKELLRGLWVGLIRASFLLSGSQVLGEPPS